MARGTVIRIQELGGRELVIGGDHARGIVAENPSWQADAWGPSGGTLTLKRNPRVQWPDLRAYAPVVVEARGLPVWRGRIKQTPMTDGGTARQISVTCEGQQYRLDDDVYERMYVATDLSQWKDIRSQFNTPLGATLYAAGAQVEVGAGAITLQWPKDLPIGTTSTMGVYFDAGPGNVIAQWSIDMTSSGNSVSNQLYVRGYNGNPNFYSGTTPSGTAFEGGLNTTYVNPPVVNGVFTVPCRYIAIFDFCTTGFTPSADLWWKFTGIRLFTIPAYATGTITPGTSSTSSLPVTSILKASDVVLDALAQATADVSADTSLVSPTSFFIPEFNMSGPSTPREAITAANLYHSYQTRVRADNRAEYRPLPALASIEVGSDSRFDEASAGDASEVYSSVVLSYTDAAGDPQRIQRSQPAPVSVISSVGLSNPGFETNLSLWSITPAGTRDTVIFDTGIASAKLPSDGFQAFATTSSWTGALTLGKTYTLTGAVRVDTALRWWGIVLNNPLGHPIARVDVNFPAANTWVPFALPFTPLIGGNHQVIAFISGGTFNGWIDSFLLSETVPSTIVDRWGFKRTKVIDTNMMLTPVAAAQIADTFLLAHRTTPLKGKLVVTGNGRAWRVPSGAGMSAAELLTCTGDLVRMRHLTDPDTGKLGRLGRIANVTWDADSDTATLDIDSTSTNFEALMSRMAIVTGQIRG